MCGPFLTFKTGIKNVRIALKNPLGLKKASTQY